MPSKSHWEQVYASKAVDTVSWFQEHALTSLRLIESAGVGTGAAIVDVGGGASTLIDDLLARGYRNLTVLDLSATALAKARQRLGTRASSVNWIEADITRYRFPRHSVDVWHDRAVFHFLTAPEGRAAYVRSVLHAVKPGGLVIVATFSEGGPEQCSGLPVMRYDAESLHDEFGAPFSLLGHECEEHHTPAGKIQQFIYCYCRKVDT
jgi:SAM-dependent methyltransferase